MLKEKTMQGKTKLHYMILFTIALLLLVVGTAALAQKGGDQDIQTIAQNITSSYQSLGELMIGTAYLAGIGFAIAGLFKFKQHRDNPTQVPLGTPIIMIAIGIGLVFLPSIFGPTGSTIFGEGKTAGGFKGKGILQTPGGAEGGGGGGS